MAATATTLKARFTEFAATADALVTLCLAEATRRTSAAALGARFDDAVMLRAAHLLAISPQGMNARLETSPGANPLLASTYGQELMQLFREACGGPHMVGVGPLA